MMMMKSMSRISSSPTSLRARTFFSAAIRLVSDEPATLTPLPYRHLRYSGVMQNFSHTAPSAEDSDAIV